MRIMRIQDKMKFEVISLQWLGVIIHLKKE